MAKAPKHSRTLVVPALCAVLSLLLLCVITETSGQDVALEDDPGQGQELPGLMDSSLAGTSQRRAMRSTQKNKQGYTFKQKRRIVRKHNALRLSVQPPASNMYEMRWSSVLEKRAQNHSNKCVFEHNNDSSTGNFGENLYFNTSIYDGRAAVQYWFDEMKYYDYETNTCEEGKTCKNYKKVVWAKSRWVGCGVKSCAPLKTDDGELDFAYLVVCNYSPRGNYVKRKPYKKGDGPTKLFGCAALVKKSKN